MALFDAVKLGVGGEWLGGCEKCVCSKKLQRGAAAWSTVGTAVVSRRV